MVDEQGGLLSFLQTPEGQGLLAGAFGGLAGARRGQPWNSLGRAGMAGLQGYANAQDQGWQKEQRDYQRATMEKQKQLDALAPQFLKTGAQNALGAGAQAGSVGPTVANAERLGSAQPSFDLQGYTNAAFGIDPKYAIGLQASLAKETPFDKVSPKDYTPESVATFAKTRNFGDLQPMRKLDIAPNGQVVDLYRAKPGQAFGDPNKPFSVGADGGIVPNQGYQTYEINKAKAGAPSVSIKNDVKTGESIAGQIGPMVKDSYTAAQGAVQTADAANRVIQAVDSGKVIAGPLASGRLSALQVADVLGVAGESSQEKIANTRQAIQGLAQMTLQGRKQMSGQGAITESEGKLAERAISGDINMTAAEIKQLAAASKRAARFTYDQHQRQLTTMRGRQDLSGMADFYGTAPFPDGGGQSDVVDWGSLK